MLIGAIDNHWRLPVFLAAICLLLPSCGRKPKPTADQVGDTEAVVNRPAHELRGYVGSQSCAECHEEISLKYRDHSMAKSAAALDGDVRLSRLDLATFEADGFRYSVRPRGDHWVHHQGRLTADGSEVANIDLVAQHVIGSGNHGQSFLVERDGYLFLSPITWYPDKQIWDLSPGYEKNNSQFNRPVIEVCLYCHTDIAAAVPDTVNRYDSPPIHSHAIGCERCHGPGQAHVTRQQSASLESDDTIVNPGKLAPALREAVCQQCHLSGSTRVLKPGKSLYDYRPGLPLESAYTVFSVEAGEQQERFVGHVEQMYESRCFQQSSGKLGCISCHDPHGLPSVEEKTAFYRDRCMQCHESESCAEPLAERQLVTAEDNCVVCHMPPRETEIRHAAITDHSIPRTPEALPEGLNRKQKLFAFPSHDQAQPTPRDEAIAMVRIATRDPDLFSEAELNRAQNALEQSIVGSSDDFAAMEALAELYLAGGQVDQALRICRDVLARSPRREQTLLIVADTHSQMRSFAQAIPAWKKAIEVNPWMSKYWYKLAQAYAATNQWYVCRQIAGEAKMRFPTSIGVRHLLVQANLQLDDLAAADREFKELEDFHPDGFESLREWYREARPSR